MALLPQTLQRVAELVPVLLEDLLYRKLEQSRQLKGQRQAWVIPLGFNRVDGLEGKITGIAEGAEPKIPAEERKPGEHGR